MVNAMKNQSRFMSSVGVKPLTTLTDDELVMKQTGESGDAYITSPPEFIFTNLRADKKSK